MSDYTPRLSSLQVAYRLMGADLMMDPDSKPHSPELMAESDDEFNRAIAKVKADTIREVADAVELIDPAWDSALFVDGSYHPLPEWLRNRANTLDPS